MYDLTETIRIRRELRNRISLKEAQPAVKTYFYEYVQVSSFHGLRHLTVAGLHTTERIAWALLILLAMIGTVYLSVKSWQRYKFEPVTNAIDRDFTSWQTPLPAILLCPLTKISQRKLNDYISSLPEDEKSETKEFLLTLSTLDYNTLDKIPSSLTTPAGINPKDYMKILDQLKQDLGFQVRPVGEEIVTETGFCYIFNSNISAYQSTRIFFDPFSAIPNQTAELAAGSPLSGDLISVILGINQPYSAQFTSPNDIPDFTAKRYQGLKNTYQMLEFQPQSITAEKDLRQLTTSQRRCRFPDETNLPISQIYSYNICRMNCRRDLALKLCKCVPHFYPIIDESDICDLEGLRCIGKQKSIFLKLSTSTTKINCECLPMCDYNMYYILRAENSRWFVGTNFKWSITKFPKWRVRREVIFGFGEFLVSFGAIAGLFLGCSVLSYVEIIYFFTLRSSSRSMAQYSFLSPDADTDNRSSTVSKIINVPNTDD